MTIDELIAALDKADATSLDLDHAISEVAQVDDGFGVPLYTASVDAALTLVPKGAWWEIRAPYGEKHLARSSAYAAGKCVGYSRHKIPAISICIAALKARREA